ncbi:YbjN domain-containing protein, partial [Streptomyces zhihengii]
MADAERATQGTEQTTRVVEQTLRDAELDWESPEPGTYVVQLPGTRKLSTTCSLRVGRHSLSVNAFVIRHPDENDAAVHRWLLERNLKLYGVSYAVDRLGDIYLTGRLPLSVV